MAGWPKCAEDGKVLETLCRGATSEGVRCLGVVSLSLGLAAVLAGLVAVILSVFVGVGLLAVALAALFVVSCAVVLFAVAFLAVVLALCVAIFFAVTLMVVLAVVVLGGVLGAFLALASRGARRSQGAPQTVLGAAVETASPARPTVAVTGGGRPQGTMSPAHLSRAGPANSVLRTGRIPIPLRSRRRSTIR